jgi:hypothetical protein
MNGSIFTLGAVGALALLGSRSRAGSRSRRPRPDDAVHSDDYGGPDSLLYQPRLYHITSRANMDSIRRGGLRVGRTSNYPSCGIDERCKDKIFFSFQPDRWAASYKDPVLLSVPTYSVPCVYDGEEWIYDWDEEDEDRFLPYFVEGRLSDCYTTRDVPLNSLRVEDWSEAIGRYSPWGLPLAPRQLEPTGLLRSR